LDVNVWLALALQSHPHHRKALQEWSGFDRPSFCRITQLGFMRLLSNLQVMGQDVLDPGTAWRKYEQLSGSGTIQFLDEPAGLASQLKAYATGAKAARDFWTDVYLAAFAKAARMRLVSFDARYTRFQRLDFLQLKGC
jgi:toxin-antitoxin system PIN domain toxin